MRYSKLQELDPTEERDLVVHLCEFFNPIRGNNWRDDLGIARVEGHLLPLSISDFFNWTKKSRGIDYFPLMHKVRETVRKLVNAAVLVGAGKTKGSPFFSDCYYTEVELSSLASKGSLWIGRVLGAKYIGSQLNPSLVQVLGRTRAGDEAVGSAIHILPDLLLTCAHVVDDMTVNDHLMVNGTPTEVLDCRSAADVDVGIVRIRSVPMALPDLALRSPVVLEEIVIAGYPSIPTIINSVPTFQRGEISAIGAETLQRTTVDLFTAIARPGNSGGPIVGLDGRIVGIVTRSLERDREQADAMPPLPFFASVPASVIQASVRTLTGGVELPWEDYN